jgi:hypothetical protein
MSEGSEQSIVAQIYTNVITRFAQQFKGQEAVLLNYW